MSDWERNRTIFDELKEAADASAKSLNKIGEGDWTPQDSAHAWLLAKVDKLLADPHPLRTGRIIHGDNLIGDPNFDPKGDDDLSV